MSDDEALRRYVSRSLFEDPAYDPNATLQLVDLPDRQLWVERAGWWPSP